MPIVPSKPMRADPNTTGSQAWRKSVGYASLVASAAVLVGCLTTKDAPNMASLNVSWVWQPSDRCGSKSPAFTITNIPADTKTLDFNMVDLNNTSFRHGGGKVAYTGSGTIPAGAFSYSGPCPPGIHQYEFTVAAINAAGDTVLGRGKAVQQFPPK